MGAEGLKLSFTDDAITRLAEVAWKVNENTENIGARRLHTMLERLLESLSFDAGDQVTEQFEVTAEYVEEKLGKLAEDEDLSRYIL
jgi:ATP-dependent HslUV protease ATP-binding subunit HslU